MDNADLRQTPQLLAQALRQITAVMTDELSLAKAEMSRNLSRAGLGLIFFGIAALLTLVALNVLATALVAYLAAAGLSAGSAALIVGAGLLLIAAGLAALGKARLSAQALAPKRTVAQLRRDIADFKESEHADA